MTAPRQGRSLTMLREASRYADEHPAATVLVIAHTQDFCGYLKELARVERLSGRLKFVAADRAREAARASRGEFFVDHTVWAHKQASRIINREAWGALVNMRKAG